MSIAWTTFSVIAFLLPGVLFFIGLAARERYTREIIKSNAISDVGMTIVFSLIIHLAAWGVLTLFGFELGRFIRPLASYESLPAWLIVNLIIERLFPIAAYILVTGLIGFLLGLGVAQSILSGKLAFLATHKWFYQVMRSMRSGVVTAYVMTTTKEAETILMYKGLLSEFYLNPDGKFVYVVLQACSRFHMKLDGDSSMIGTQMELFGEDQAKIIENSWNYLLIDGANIANILLHPSPEIVPSPEGSKALDDELKKLEQEEQ